MENWDEVRTAYQVARMGTVSGAAEVLGVHHATVIRHIDAIEARLGVKLFQRHARGYTPTEAGQDLLRVAQATDDQFGQLVGRLKGHGDAVSGELVVTSLSSMSTLLVPALTEFQRQHPELVIRFLTGSRLFRLEYGEAHVAIRAGSPPEQPDNVVQPFMQQQYGLYASASYLETYGPLKGVEDMHNHRFICNDDIDSRAPYFRWLRANVAESALSFRCVTEVSMQDALLAGAGIGFLTRWEAARHPELIQMMEPLPEWAGELWLVTHVDLHRTTKVQSFLSFLKAEAKAWTA
ncbi:LysR family transcriptional regulator [Phaeobacter gallaeciensis]|uniref:Transcriptional regulator, lysR family n=1 Tax=Phaeobacter gallaeciensis TaxID=60890 RepID=A0AAC9Z653_9RHOB|nr:LysR family transcriptional regulator [Phaeobacter gallaeciensis]AHD08000.1 Transcriptional regulator [Phaeobacter gallaeciensis DSM 26640]ATE91266.1 transcriptional regulator, lysR family [Phaeobacter gallaeciensis]ATE95542.1 transcriptional regulator, lysR family [Phaeobacter gallaeciensis]ATE99881.1 transcriptional regulator, lysR family [Phaeobacter gallaeciensis]ATF04314.1 transcriptional regulator, lysR family [Phaeobacter gallaeciensis]